MIPYFLIPKINELLTSFESKNCWEDSFPQVGELLQCKNTATASFRWIYWNRMNSGNVQNKEWILELSLLFPLQNIKITFL